MRSVLPIVSFQVWKIIVEAKLLTSAAALATLLFGTAARAQSLTVVPVNVELPPGQLATTLTVINYGDVETSIQVRILSWNQPGGVDQLVPSDEVLASPPIATIEAGGTQIVRLVVRHPAQGQEATYRILLDQIPPVAAPGTVAVALRLSIPIFVEPPKRTAPHMQFHVETKGALAYLVMANDGGRHDKVRDLTLTTTAGHTLTVGPNSSPYVLAGTVSRRRITSGATILEPGEMLRLTGHGETGPLEQAVPVLVQP